MLFTWANTLTVARELAPADRFALGRSGPILGAASRWSASPAQREQAPSPQVLRFSLL